MLGCRAVASWNMPLGSRRRTLLHRSATRTSWADSYTFAKTERPSLDSAPPAADAVTLAAECLAAAALEVASAATQHSTQDSSKATKVATMAAGKTHTVPRGPAPSRVPSASVYTTCQESYVSRIVIRQKIGESIIARCTNAMLPRKSTNINAS